jgi:hypothetical protein
MPDQQCGLCLSCGAPFLPSITEVDFFNREGNLSMLFLNTQFQRNAEIQRMYTTPKLCSERQACHMFHRAYHQTALEYMCTRHNHDGDVGMAVPFAPNQRIPAQNNTAFLYYHTATGNKGPRGARWNRPAANERLDMDRLFSFIRDCSNVATVVIPREQREVTYDMCQGCNSLMTQKSHMRFLLGLRNAGAKNTRGRIVPAGAYREFNVEANRRPLEDAYGNWRVQNAVLSAHPSLRKSDSEAPAIAYYLHMCLPFHAAGAPAPFHAFGNRHKRVQAFYLEMCWLILEIACLAILLEEGTVTKPGGTSRSHGQHQHVGVLDVYVSFFLWRLMRLQYGKRPSVRRIDFIQFHQKYYADAKNCPGLLNDAERGVITGRLVYSSSNQAGTALVEEICRLLMDCYEVKLDHMISHCAGLPIVPRHVREYFLPVDVILTLRARSGQVRVLVFPGMFFYWCNSSARRPPATTSSRR